MYQPEQPIFDEQPESNIEVTIGIEDVPKPWWKSWYFALQITLVDFTPFMWVSGFASLAGIQSASFTATMLSACFFCMGICTFLQTTIGNRLPIVQGTSSSLMSSMGSIAGVYGLPATWGSILVGGFLEFLLGATRVISKIRTFLPPVVLGSVVTSIGFVAARIAVQWTFSNTEPVYMILAVIAFIAYKIFSRRRAPAPAAATAAPGGMAAPQAPYQPMAREDMQQPAANDAWGGLRSQPIASAEAVNGPTLPAGFDAEEFLRGAKMAYTRLQKAWDSRDLNDIAQFASPAVMEAVREQLQAEPTPTTTELLLVNAQLLEVTQEPGGVERAQVYFDVLMREDPKQETPSSVREIWHFMRENAQSMWRLDGIQPVDA